MNQTTIEWVLNRDNKTLGYTLNPITGCLNNCSYCYARKLANGRLKKLYLANSMPSTNPEKAAVDPFWPRFWPERMKDFSRLPIGAGVFIVDMGDMFGPWVPEEWQAMVMEKIRYFADVRFYLLTKFPSELLQWSPFPPNCWVGVTATDALSFCAACQGLRRINATVRYISVEPLVGPFEEDEVDDYFDYFTPDLVIVGAQTKPLRLPKVEDVNAVVEAADMHEARVFVKDNLGRNTTEKDMPILFYAEPGLETGGRTYGLRQEMPDDG